MILTLKLIHYKDSNHFLVLPMRWERGSSAIELTVNIPFARYCGMKGFGGLAEEQSVVVNAAKLT
jgi:hypothetical protein